MIIAIRRLVSVLFRIVNPIRPATLEPRIPSRMWREAQGALEIKSKKESFVRSFIGWGKIAFRTYWCVMRQERRICLQKIESKSELTLLPDKSATNSTMRRFWLATDNFRKRGFCTNRLPACGSGCAVTGAASSTRLPITCSRSSTASYCW
jgi:hypothetical protein